MSTHGAAIDVLERPVASGKLIGEIESFSSRPQLSRGESEVFRV
jgi:hypothetical protein